MQYRHLGRTGLRVSELSFGSWVTFSNQIDVKAAVDCMSAAYEAGVNFFDNAEVYAGGESEKVMGAALKKLGWRRSSYLVSTKFFWGLIKASTNLIPLIANASSRASTVPCSGCSSITWT